MKKIIASLLVLGFVGGIGFSCTYFQCGHKKQSCSGARQNKECTVSSTRSENCKSCDATCKATDRVIKNTDVPEDVKSSLKEWYYDNCN